MSSAPLNKEQEQAVHHPNGPLLMAAGAGSGKTRALTGRLRALIARGTPPHEIVAITFTNKAAREMRERVFGPENADQKWHPHFPVYGEPFIGTFHSFGARLMKEFAPLLGRTVGFTIYDDDDSLSTVKKIAKSLDLDKESFKPAALMSRISTYKSELRDAAELEDSTDSRDKTFFAVFRMYEKALRDQNAFDFDDLIEKPVRLLTENAELRTKYQRLFSHILVDEYQDINTAQYQLIRALAEEHRNISVVGDDAQAIYSFRGADFRNFLNFKRDWPNATIINLEQNYRSSGTIVEAASGLIQCNAKQQPKKLWTENPPGEKITLVAADDADSESGWIAGEIFERRRANQTESIAILYRTNAQSRALEQALISENIPYRIYGGLKFYDRKEIRDVLAGIRLAANPLDEASAERLLKSLGKKAGTRVVMAMREAGSSRSTPELIELFLSRAEYREFLIKEFNNPEERIENIAELSNFSAGFSSLEEFLERAALLSSADTPNGHALEAARSAGYKPPANPINLMTVHVAKGLEFDTVFIAGCNEGVLPHERSMGSDSEIEEERRLMYVAMTRARKKLYIVFANFPSRFLSEIPQQTLTFVSLSGRMDKLPDEDEMWLEQ